MFTQGKQSNLVARKEIIRNPHGPDHFTKTSINPL